MPHKNTNKKMGVKKKEATSIIDVKGLNVIYNQGEENEAHILKGVDVNIKKGEYIIIFGPSGCGKSTLLFSMSGLQKATTGTVIVDGIDISKEKTDSKKMVSLHRNTLSTIFQAFHLIPSLNIFQNVSLPSVFSDIDRGERKKRAYELLKRFGIFEQAQKLPSQLSGGQKQRVAISRALMNDPKILFADEPVGNLDAKSADILLGILKDLNEKEGRTIVLVTHDPRHLPFADRVFYINEGKIIKVVVNEGKKEMLKDSPKEGTYVYKTPDKDWKERDEYERLLEKITMSRKQLAIVERRVEVLKHKDIDVMHNMHKGDTFSETVELKTLSKGFKEITSLWKPRSFESFKIRQFAQYILSGINSEQVNMVEDAIAQCYTSQEKADYPALLQKIDEPIRKGGVGLNRSAARHMTEDVESILTMVNYLRESSGVTHTNIRKVQATYLYNSFISKYKIKQQGHSQKVMKKALMLRLENIISIAELTEILDESIKKGGAGLHRRDAKHIANSMEIMMLLLYNPEIASYKKEFPGMKNKVSQASQVKVSILSQMPTLRKKDI